MGRAQASICAGHGMPCPYDRRRTPSCVELSFVVHATILVRAVRGAREFACGLLGQCGEVAGYRVRGMARTAEMGVRFVDQATRLRLAAE
jgi:hypothetical protein